MEILKPTKTIKDHFYSERFKIAFPTVSVIKGTDAAEPYTAYKI